MILAKIFLLFLFACPVFADGVEAARDSAWLLQRPDDLTEWKDFQPLTRDAAGLATITALPAPAGAMFYR